MAKEKKQPHKVVMTEGKREIVRSLLAEYDIKDAHDIQESLKDLLESTIKEWPQNLIIMESAERNSKLLV